MSKIWQNSAVLITKPLLTRWNQQLHNGTDKERTDKISKDWLSSRQNTGETVNMYRQHESHCAQFPTAG